MRSFSLPSEQALTPSGRCAYDRLQTELRFTQRADRRLVGRRAVPDLARAGRGARCFAAMLRGLTGPREGDLTPRRYWLERSCPLRPSKTRWLEAATRARAARAEHRTRGARLHPDGAGRAALGRGQRSSLRCLRRCVTDI